MSRGFDTNDPENIANMKYCKEHDQKYFNYLSECPICVGVRQGNDPEHRRRTMGGLQSAKPVLKDYRGKPKTRKVKRVERVRR